MNQLSFHNREETFRLQHYTIAMLERILI